MRYQMIGSLLVAVLLVLGTVGVVSATLNLSAVCAVDDEGHSSGGGDDD